MSWITGAKRTYLPSLQIQGDAFAVVEFLEEPVPQNFGTKKVTRDKIEIEVPDIRVRAKVRYLSGTCRSKQSKQDSLPAKAGNEYTLWIGSVLSGKILDALNWNDSNSAPELIGTQWRVWRGAVGSFGRRVYETEIVSVEGYEPPAPPTPEDQDALLIDSLKKAIIRLADIDTVTWYNFCKEKGAKDEADAIRITKLMEEQGIVRIEATQIFYIEPPQ